MARRRAGDSRPAPPPPAAEAQESIEPLGELEAVSSFRRRLALALVLPAGAGLLAGSWTSSHFHDAFGGHEAIVAAAEEADKSPQATEERNKKANGIWGAALDLLEKTPLIGGSIEAAQQKLEEAVQFYEELKRLKPKAIRLADTLAFWVPFALAFSSVLMLEIMLLLLKAALGGSVDRAVLNNMEAMHKKMNEIIARLNQNPSKAEMEQLVGRIGELEAQLGAMRTGSGDL